MSNQKKPTKKELIIKRFEQDPQEAYRMLRPLGQEISKLRREIQELNQILEGHLNITAETCDRIRALFIKRINNKPLTDSQIIEQVFNLKRSKSAQYRQARELVKDLRTNYTADQKKAARKRENQQSRTVKRFFKQFPELRSSA